MTQYRHQFSALENEIWICPPFLIVIEQSQQADETAERERFQQVSGVQNTLVFLLES